MTLTDQRPAAAAHTEDIPAVVRRLRSGHGQEPGSWAWGRLRPLVMHHLMGRNGLLRRVFNLAPIPFGGDADTIDQAAVLPLDPLAPVPLDAGLAAGLQEPAAREALSRLQATRAQLAGQLDALQRYAESGGILERLKERARALEVRSNDPVWLVVETALDCAVRVTGGLEIFCESLGVYLEYEFTKVKLYDEALARLGGACTGLEAFQAELGATRERLDGFEIALEGLQAAQAKSIAALPEFSRAMSEPFAKAMEAAARLADKTEASAQRVARFQVWVKAAVGVGAAATGVGVALGWLLLTRPPG